MPRRLPHVDRPAVLERLGHCRQAVTELRAGSPPRSLMRAAADQMISNIDEIAWILTGERDLFVGQGHGSALYGRRPSGLGEHGRDPSDRGAT